MTDCRHTPRCPMPLDQQQNLYIRFRRFLLAEVGRRPRRKRNDPYLYEGLLDFLWCKFNLEFHSLQDLPGCLYEPISEAITQQEKEHGV